MNLVCNQILLNSRPMFYSYGGPPTFKAEAKEQSVHSIFWLRHSQPYEPNLCPCF